jgi:hypothetical protein
MDEATVTVAALGLGVAGAQTGAAPASQTAALTADVAVGTVSLAAPLALALLAPDRGPALLGGLQDRMVRHGALVIAAVWWCWGRRCPPTPSPRRRADPGARGEVSRAAPPGPR